LVFRIVYDNTSCKAEKPNGLGVSRRHPPNRPSSKTTPNSGMIGGRLHAVLSRRRDYDGAQERLSVSAILNAGIK